MRLFRIVRFQAQESAQLDRKVDSFGPGGIFFNTLVADHAAYAYTLLLLNARGANDLHGLGKLQAIPTAKWASYSYARTFAGTSRTSRRFRRQTSSCGAIALLNRRNGGVIAEELNFADFRFAA